MHSIYDQTELRNSKPAIPSSSPSPPNQKRLLQLLLVPDSQRHKPAIGQVQAVRADMSGNRISEDRWKWSEGGGTKARESNTKRIETRTLIKQKKQNASRYKRWKNKKYKPSRHIMGEKQKLI